MKFSVPGFAWTWNCGLPLTLVFIIMAVGLKVKPCRFSSWKKRERVKALPMLQGDNLELMSWEVGISVAKVSEWQDEFVANG